MTRNEVVAEARTWIGTHFHHQAHIKGVGVDCAGLVRGVAMNLGILQPNFESLPRAKEFMAYARNPNGASLMEACRLYMTEIDKADMQPGDVVVMSFDKHPQHLAILGDYRHGGLSIIHASGRAGKVIETRMMFSNDMKFVAAFSLPGVN